MYKRNAEVCSRNNCCNGKAVSITYSQCASLSLVIQHAKRMHRAILSSVACPELQYFLHKRHEFRKNCIEVTRYVTIFSATYV